MGKGTGKLIGWYSLIRCGTVIIEFKNLREGRASYYLTQFSNKMGFDTVFLWTSRLYIPTSRTSREKYKIVPKYY